MKRDMNLIIAILEHLEAQEVAHYGALQELPGVEIEKTFLAYHGILLVEAGLVEGKRVDYAGAGFEVLIAELTWNGHEFLAATRNKGAMKQARSRFGENFEGVAFDLLKAFLIEAAKKAVGL